MKKLAALFLGLVFACPVFAQQVALQQEEAEPGLYLILDSSGSMERKFPAAKKALKQFLSSDLAGTELAFVFLEDTKEAAGT